MTSSPEKPSTELRPRLARGATRVATIDDLVGGHAGAMRDLFATAGPADPAELGDHPRGRLLSLEPFADLHVATRPLVRLISRAPGWEGVAFDHGGNAGDNRVLGGRFARFRAAVEPSELDGRPALVLRYDRNPWPLAGLRDELRRLGPRSALGAFFWQAGGRHHLLGWFGLEAT